MKKRVNPFENKGIDIPDQRGFNDKDFETIKGVLDRFIDTLEKEKKATSLISSLHRKNWMRLQGL